MLCQFLRRQARVGKLVASWCIRWSSTDLLGYAKREIKKVSHVALGHQWYTYWSHVLHILLLLLDHRLEVYVNFYSQRLVVCFALTALLFDIVHSPPSLLPIDFKLFNLVQTTRFFSEGAPWTLTCLARVLSTRTVALIAGICIRSWHSYSIEKTA